MLEHVYFIKFKNATYSYFIQKVVFDPNSDFSHMLMMQIDGAWPYGKSAAKRSCRIDAAEEDEASTVLSSQVVIIRKGQCHHRKV